MTKRTTKTDLLIRVTQLNRQLVPRGLFVELGEDGTREWSQGKVFLDLWKVAGDSEEKKVLCLADGLRYKGMLGVLRALLLWEEVS